MRRWQGGPQPTCTYPSKAHIPCGEAARQKSEFGKWYCDECWAKVCANMQVLWALWERLQK